MFHENNGSSTQEASNKDQQEGQVYEKLKSIEQAPSFLREIGESFGLLYQKRAELEAEGVRDSEVHRFLAKFENNGEYQLILEGIHEDAKRLSENSKNFANESTKESEASQSV